MPRRLPPLSSVQVGVLCTAAAALLAAALLIPRRNLGELTEGDEGPERKGGDDTGQRQRGHEQLKKKKKGRKKKKKRSSPGRWMPRARARPSLPLWMRPSYQRGSAVRAAIFQCQSTSERRLTWLAAAESFAMAVSSNRRWTETQTITKR